MQALQAQQQINDSLGQRPRLATPGMAQAGGVAPPMGGMAPRPQMPMGGMPQGMTQMPQGVPQGAPNGGFDMNKLLALLAQRQTQPQQGAMPPQMGAMQQPGQLPLNPQGGMQQPMGQPMGGQPAQALQGPAQNQINPQLLSLMARYGQQR